MNWIAVTLNTLLAGGIACAASTASKTSATAHEAPSAESSRPQAMLQASEWLPVQAREMLARRMKRHGEEMMHLTAMVLTLNHEGAVYAAEHIAEEPTIGRPTAGEHGTISELLPARFFDFQDELSDRAMTMANAARAGSYDKMMLAYNRLTETCIGCHVVYLKYEEATDSESGDLDLSLDGQAEASAQ